MQENKIENAPNALVTGKGSGGVVIIKYNAGNIRSVLFALERIGVQARVSDDVEEILSGIKLFFRVWARLARP